MRNRYLLFLQNNYSNERWMFEVFNTSEDPGCYVFSGFGDVIPQDFKYGTYDFALVHCSIPYEVEYRPCLLDTVITADGKPFVLRELRPETGMIEFRPDRGLNGDSEVWDPVLGGDRIYIDM